MKFKLLKFRYLWNNHYLLLSLIFLLAIFLYFVNITKVPDGLNQDETALGYNAYSILQTGKDEFGKIFPIYFKSFGDQKLPAYVYLTAASEKLFGLNEFAVRFPSALFGCLTILMMYGMVTEITENRKVAILASLFLVINPWHLFFSRAAFEDNLGLSFAVFGIWMFAFSMKRKKWVFLFLSLLGFALSLYSYNVTRLLAPVFLASSIYLYWKTVKSIPVKVKISASLFLVILLLPFIITFFSSAGVFSARGALITSTDIQAKSIEFRSYLTGSWLLNLLGKVFFNKYVYLVWQYSQNLVGSLATPFFFLVGSQHGSQTIGNNGQFYLIEFPLIIVGLVTIIKKKQKEFYFFIVWLIIAWMTLSLSKLVPHATRGYFLVIPLEIFSALGLFVVVTKIHVLKSNVIKTSLYIVISILCIYNLAYFFTSYFVRFPSVYAEGWRQQDKSVSQFIKTNENKYNQIIFDNSAGYMYTSLAFYNEYSPVQFQKTVRRLPDDSEGYNLVSSFGKYKWKDVDWNKDIRLPKTLIIASEKNIPPNIHPVAVFKYPKIPIVLSIKERIIQYPVQHIAYVAIESK